MGKHTSISRQLTPAINMEELTAALDAVNDNDTEINTNEHSLLLETPPGDVFVTGFAPEYTGYTRNNTISYGIRSPNSSTTNCGAVQIGSDYYIAFGSSASRYVQKATLALSSSGTAVFTKISYFSVIDGLVPDANNSSYRLRGIATDGTHLYIIDNLNNILKYTTDGTFISYFNFATLVPGYSGGQAYTGTSTSIYYKQNDETTAIVCDGNTLFVRTNYSLDPDTPVGVVIFEFTLDGTLIRNDVVNTDYHVILDPASNYETVSTADGVRQKMGSNNEGSMIIHRGHVWIRYNNYYVKTIRNYYLDFTPADIFITNVTETQTDSSGWTYHYNTGGIAFDADGNVHSLNTYVRRYLLHTTSEAVRIIAPSIGIVATVGDTITISSTNVVVSQVVSDNIVETVSIITPVELTDSIVTRKILLKDAISVINLDPLIYGLRTITPV